FNISNFYLLRWFSPAPSALGCPFLLVFPTRASDIFVLVSPASQAVKSLTIIRIILSPYGFRPFFFFYLLKRKKGRFRIYCFSFLRVCTTRHRSSWILCNIVLRS